MESFLNDTHIVFHFIELLFIIYLVIEVRSTRQLIFTFLRILEQVDNHLTKLTDKVGDQLDAEDVPIK